ncbi:Eco57I restriction-modification methylase domain-containing protein [Chitinophaga caseinilytica]|uniref:Eco57I restriction-modification methylase domain-containing protein n=1 Tax=Chitinophaga caseinilytica TaxID=2267521 RepID=UPI003C2BCC31
MTGIKKIGSYYTPTILTSFMYKHVVSEFKGRSCLSILEPSVGDGAFVKAFNSAKFPSEIENYNFWGVEKVATEMVKAKAQITSSSRKVIANFLSKDFLFFDSESEGGFDLVIGNPPYIKKSLLTKRQILQSESIHTKELGNSIFKNIWTSFLLKSISYLNEDGILAFVLPAEMLQTSFSKELQKFCVQKFERLEVFTFDDLLFECKGQDTILLFGYKKHKEKGQYYTQISDLEELISGRFLLTKNLALETTQIKWTHHVLSVDELHFIQSLADRCGMINDYCISSPGIVTAANGYFVVDEEIEKEYRLKSFTKAIIQNAKCVNGEVVFKNSHMNNLVDEKYATRFLHIPEVEKEKLPKGVRDYIKMGEQEGVNLGYKCRNRNRWYSVPNVSSPAEGFFFRRIYQYPKLIKNAAKVYVTDSAYRINMRSGFNINSLVFSFYNTLTLIFSEIYGRYYGGGVLELTPSEFKRLPIPLIEVNGERFREFEKGFREKVRITDILKQNDKILLKNRRGLMLTDEELISLQAIYEKLQGKRMKRTRKQVVK